MYIPFPYAVETLRRLQRISCRFQIVAVSWQAELLLASHCSPVSCELSVNLTWSSGKEMALITCCV